MEQSKLAHKRVGTRLVKQTYNLKTGKITKRSRVIKEPTKSFNYSRLLLSVIILVGVLLLLIFSIGKVRADWQRLHRSESIDMGFPDGRVTIVWDELEQTNCYVYINSSFRLGGISCIKK